ncbi:OsmC family protein [candidate division WOR-3 bacterium]|nr:OsmC family protein [candidate division WOR-3 bacterium]
MAERDLIAEVRKTRAVVQRIQGLSLAGKSDSGHWTMMDTKADVGGNEAATAPMELLLISLGGCTAMDVLSILEKMRQPVQDFRVELEAEHAPEHPKVYTRIRLLYVVNGHVEPRKLERAIELSQTTYCSVTAMLRKSVDIETSYRIEPVDQ